MLYPVAIRQIEGVYHAHIPDIPDLEIQSLTMAEIIGHAREIVTKHIGKLVNDDQPTPEASEISTHLVDPKYAGWTWAVVTIDMSRIVFSDFKITVSVKQNLHDRIQQHISTENIDINTFIIDAIEKSLG